MKAVYIRLITQYSRESGDLQMRSWKALHTLIISVVIVMVVAACGNSGANTGGEGKGVKISLLNSKGEIQSQLEECSKGI